MTSQSLEDPMTTPTTGAGAVWAPALVFAAVFATARVADFAGFAREVESVLAME
jgi:hypothetical protein